jgi:hypothetical protein
MTDGHAPSNHVPRTLVVTIDAHHLPDDEWRTLKSRVNHAIDKIIQSYATSDAHVWRRSDDVTKLLEADE